MKSDGAPICLTGSSGQVGSAISRIRPSIHPLNHRLDSDLEGLIAAINTQKPRAIIHAAAYTAVDHAETEPEIVDLVNHRAIDSLGDWCNETQTILVHYSTDYVFDGHQSNGYREEDACNPLNCYGLSKYRGELAFLKHAPPGCIFRTSWVLGRGNNFIKTILTLGLVKPELAVIDDQIGRPTSAQLLAEAGLEVVDREMQFRDIEKRIHLTDAGAPVSWHGLAVYAINRARDWHYPGITATNIKPVSTEAYGQQVKRPANSILICDRYDQLLDTIRPNWQTTVDSIVEECAKELW